MENLNRQHPNITPKLPIKVIQFGEGNFMRAFADYAIAQLNKHAAFGGGIAVVQPIASGMAAVLNEQEGLYTLFSKGVSEGEEIQEKFLIDSIQTAVDPYTDYTGFIALAKEADLEFILSNTTEAGIAYDPNDRLDMQPPNSFPAKLTQLLYARYQYTAGDPDKGLTILPCELINYNADTLKEIVLQYVDLWQLGPDFKKWINQSNSFHNTLVDRIVPGYPKDNIADYNAQLPYKDRLIVTSETFFLWVVEGGADLQAKLPFQKTDLQVKVVPDMQPYRTRKVRILNGAHTCMVPLSLLHGNTTVRETLEDPFSGLFVKEAIFKEIIPTLHLDQDELEQFAHEVIDRFKNPFIEHRLASIALNSISKFKVRVLPSLLEFSAKKGNLPQHLTYAFACLIRFYSGSWNEKTLPVQDSPDIVSDMQGLWQNNTLSGLVPKVLAKKEYWGQDLNRVPELAKNLELALEILEEKGVEAGFDQFKQRLLTQSTQHG